jgi:hypothetical protein
MIPKAASREINTEKGARKANKYNNIDKQG